MTQTSLSVPNKSELPLRGYLVLYRALLFLLPTVFGIRHGTIQTFILANIIAIHRITLKILKIRVRIRGEGFIVFEISDCLATELKVVTEMVVQIVSVPHIIINILSTNLDTRMT